MLQGSPELTKAHQFTKVVRFTKEGWRVDQLEPRLAGMLNVARMQVWSGPFPPSFG